MGSTGGSVGAWDLRGELFPKPVQACDSPHLPTRLQVPLVPGVRSEMETLGRSCRVTLGSPGAKRVRPAPQPLLPQPAAAGANTVLIGSGQAVTEAEMRLMIGFLGREEVL